MTELQDKDTNRTQTLDFLLIETTQDKQRGYRGSLSVELRF